MRRLAWCLTVIGTIFALFASSASAAATRAEYVAQTDEICKDSNKQLKKALSGFKFKPPKGDTKEDFFNFLKQVASLVNRSNKVFGDTLQQLYGVAPAPGDEVAVAGWLDGLGDYKRLTDKYVRAVRHQKFRKASRAESEALNALLGGARLVNGYGFKYCPGGEVVTEGF